MTDSEDSSIKNCNQQIALPGISITQPFNQWNRNDVDNSNSYHSANRPGSIDLCSFGHILSHCTTQRSIGNIYTGIS